MHELHSKFLFALDGRAIKRIQSAGPQAHSSPAILPIWQSKRDDCAPCLPFAIFPPNSVGIKQSKCSFHCQELVAQDGARSFYKIKRRRKNNITCIKRYSLYSAFPESVLRRLKSSLIQFLFWGRGLWRHGQKWRRDGCDAAAAQQQNEHCDPARFISKDSL